MSSCPINQGSRVALPTITPTAQKRADTPTTVPKEPKRMGISTLELKVSYLERVPPEPMYAEARVLRWGGSVVFLEADLINEQGQVLVKATSTGKLLRPKKPS